MARRRVLAVLALVIVPAPAIAQDIETGTAPAGLRSCRGTFTAYGPSLGSEPDPRGVRYRIRDVRVSERGSCRTGRSLVRAWYRRADSNTDRRTVRGHACSTYDYGHRGRCWRRTGKAGRRGPQILVWSLRGDPQ